tara:strand:+ start:222 stop:830 length:609 start_codon:yes stop_codon:yes gene_type:complete
MESLKPTVHIVDDDPAVRQSVKWLVESISRRVDIHESARVFLDAYHPDMAGCVLTDVRMPEMSGLQLLEELRARQSRIPVIVLTAHGDVVTAVKAMKSGAFDFLEKPVNNQVLLDLIETAILADREQRRAQQALTLTLEKFSLLTAREAEVMQLVVDGHPNKQIARDLGISPKTVEAHRAKVMEKMSANSLAELVRLASVCF